MGFLRRKPPLAEERIAWMFDTWGWLLGNFGGYRAFQETPLVEPSAEQFPLEGLADRELAEAAFDEVRRIAGMEAWPCRLAAQGRRPELLAQPGLVEQTERGLPLGTFSLADEGREPEKPADAAGAQPRGVEPRLVATISYSPELVEDPEALVATLAHELAHYRISAAPTAPPGGPHALEDATDVASAFLGFGIFGANTAFRFQQFSDGLTYGWQWQTAGYLDQAEWAYALAIFLALRDLPPKKAREWLDRNPRGYLDEALRDLRSRGAELERLRRIEDNRGDTCSERLRVERERLRRGQGRLARLTPGANLGLRAMARCLLGEELADLRPELAALRRRPRPPREPHQAVQHWCGLAGAAVLLGEDAPELARLGLVAFERLVELPGLAEMPSAALEQGLALHHLAGHRERAADLVAARQQLPAEEGLERITHELLFLATSSRDVAGEEPLIWSAVRGFLAELELGGGEAAAAFPCLLAARLGTTGSGLASQLRGRAPALDTLTLTETPEGVADRIRWIPLGVHGGADGDEGALRLVIALNGVGAVDGAADPASPLTGELYALLSALTATEARPRRPRWATRVRTPPTLRDLRGELGVDVLCDVAAELPDSALPILSARYAAALRHLRIAMERYPSPAEVRRVGAQAPEEQG